MKVALNRRRASWPFLSEVFFLFPQVFLQAGEYGAPWKNNRGGWEKKMGQKKKLLGEISSSPQKETQARKNVEYYINIVFPFCTDFFGRKRINRKKKREMVPVWALFFLLGKKNPGTSWLGYFSSLFPLCCCKWLYEGQAFLGGNYCSVLGFVGGPAFICVLFIHSHLIIISWSVQKIFEVLKIYFA